MMRPFSPRAPIILASISGTFIGSIVLALILFAVDPEGAAALLSDVSLYLIMSALIVPVSAFAILIFGYPAAAAVGKAWRAWWVPLAAILMGALAGLITRITLTSVIAGGIARAEAFGVMPVDPGLVFGACVGLAYWYFERDWQARQERRRAAEGPGEEIPTSREFSRLP